MKKFMSPLLSCLLTALLFAHCTSHPVAYETPLNANWQLTSSATLTVGGDKVSTTSYQPQAWHTIQLPSTVLAGLCQAGVYKDIYFSDNLTRIPTEPFERSWWYRKAFTIDRYSTDNFYELLFEGINYRANIWVNGTLVGEAATIEGPFSTHQIDITPYAKEQNIVAVEVFPPHKTDLTIGFVDWNPNTPDKNMGLWRGVNLLQSAAVAIENIAITTAQLDLVNYAKAALQVDVELKNKRAESQKGTVKVTIEGGIELELPYTLEANEIKRLQLTASDYPALLVKNPRVWWPIHMGSPELYSAKVTAYTNGEESSAKQTRFGIRTVDDYTFAYGEEEIRGYKINGIKTLIKGGGWVDDMTLADSNQKVRAQVEYVKQMNLNTIRLEGFWGNSKELYEACDENGILLMVGLSCQWEWEGYSGRPEHQFMNVDSPEDIALISRSFQDQVKWGMNHPSIFLWVYGSDKLPTPAFERALNTSIRAYDNDRCILASCKNRWQEDDKRQISEVSGNPGVKMLGPYEVVPPLYWYQDKNLGGAYGFNTETGPGAQIPPIESIKKMLAAKDLPLINGEGWQYHCGRNEFQTLDKFLVNYEARYWKAENVEDFAFDVQLSNYELIRAMFEAFEVNRGELSTGIIQWMLNSAWPEMYWQLYDWYLNPNGAFYGTKTACQPLNLIYNYATKGIYWNNSTPTQVAARAEVRLYDLQSNLIHQEQLPVNLTPFSVEQLSSLAPIKSPSDVYFLSLRLYDESEKELSNNFYWLSAAEDKLDYSQSTWYYTPQSEYASYQALQELPSVEVTPFHILQQKDDKEVATVHLTNKSSQIAFFIEMQVVDIESNESVLPILWSDNYVSLLPGETRTFTAEFDAQGAKTTLLVKGFNTTQQ
ncbi:MAG: glycosyl hydrolase 2 galactose-binding domain-containing protein [Phocaeicola sp.]